MSLYTMTVDGVDQTIANVRRTKGIGESDAFEASLKYFNLTTAYLSEVLIYRKGTLCFCGLFEKRRIRNDEQGQEVAVSGRDYGAKLSYLLLDNVLFARTEPADIIRAFLRRTVEVYSFRDQFDDALNFAANRGTTALQYGLLDCLDNQAAKNMLVVTTDAGAGSWTDYVIRSYVCPLSNYLGNRLNWTNTACGVIGGYADANNYIVGYLGYDGTDLTLYLSKVIAGVETVLASVAFEWSYLTTYDMMLRLKTTTTDLYVDGEKLLTGTIPAGRNIGNAGVISGGAHCQFDDFFVSLSGTTATASLNSATAINALDGDLNTFWTSGAAQAVGQWFRYDLGTTKSNVCRVTVFQGEATYAKNYTVEVSTDGSAYTPVLTRSGDYRQTIEAFFTAQSVRYIKITITTADAAYWDVHEIRAAVEDDDQILEEGTITDIGYVITHACKQENRLSASQRISEVVGCDFWVDLDKLANFTSRGTDKSTLVTFQYGENIASIDRDRSIEPSVFCNNLTLLGHGSGDDQLKVTVKDQDSIDLYGQVDFTITESDIVSLDLLAKRAAVLLAYLKPPPDLIDLSFTESFTANSYGPADRVHIVYGPLEVDGNYKLMSEEHSFSESGEEVSMSLADSDRLRLPARSISDIVKNLEDSTLDVLNYPAALGFRYESNTVNGLKTIGTYLPENFS